MFQPILLHMDTKIIESKDARNLSEDILFGVVAIRQKILKRNVYLLVEVSFNDLTMVQGRELFCSVHLIPIFPFL